MGRSAKVYETLAATARSWGYPAVTAAAVHDWRKRRLLPAVIVRHPEFGKTRTEIPAQTIERLRAICALRYDRDLRDLRVLALVLWIDGADQRIEDIRKGALAASTVVSTYLRRTGSRARARDVDDPDADIDALAVRLAHQQPPLADQFHGEQVSDAALETSADEFLRGMTGRTRADDLDPEALEPLGLAIGLRRAGVEAPPGVQPWLSASPGDALLEAASVLNEPALVARLEAATDGELIEARDVTRDLMDSLSRAARLLALAAGPGEFGLGVLAPFSSSEPFGKAVLFLNAVMLSARARVASQQFAESTADFEALIELGQQWLTEHPEHDPEVRKRGLTAVVSALANSESTD